jgi:hypothetical protein
VDTDRKALHERALYQIRKEKHQKLLRERTEAEELEELNIHLLPRSTSTRRPFIAPTKPLTSKKFEKFSALIRNDSEVYGPIDVFVGRSKQPSLARYAISQKAKTSIDTSQLREQRLAKHVFFSKQETLEIASGRNLIAEARSEDSREYPKDSNGFAQSTFVVPDELTTTPEKSSDNESEYDASESESEVEDQTKSREAVVAQALKHYPLSTFVSVLHKSR